MILRLITTLLVLNLSACSIEQDPPKAGPEGSWWLGGSDGGVYIKISDDGNPDDAIYEGVIYYQHDESVWYKGPFKFVGDIQFDENNHQQYIFWDGERVHLKGGAYLEAINPIPPL